MAFGLIERVNSDWWMTPVWLARMGCDGTVEEGLVGPQKITKEKKQWRKQQEIVANGRMMEMVGMR